MGLYTVTKNVIQSIYEEFTRKWAATFLLKPEILFKFQIFLGVGRILLPNERQKSVDQLIICM